MSVPNCLRCLTRPSTAATTAFRQTLASVYTPSTTVGRIAPFSTTLVQYAPPPQKNAKGSSGRLDKNVKRMANGHVRIGRRPVVSKKKKMGTRPKAPAPGERKAWRKRVLLSNDNALRVPGLVELDAEKMVDAANVAKIMSLPDSVIDQLRTVEAFKPTQNWGFFRKPSVLIRPETVDLMTRMQEAVAKKQTLKLVLDGEKLTGKSILMLQAITQAFLKDWIVINIPEGTTTSSHDATEPILTPDLQHKN